MDAPGGPPLGGSPQQAMQLGYGPADSHGVRPTMALETKVIAASFFAHVGEGIVLYEPFGGLCAGLEMVLANGIPVKRYLYTLHCLASLQRLQRLQLRRLRHLVRPAQLLVRGTELLLRPRQPLGNHAFHTGQLAPGSPLEHADQVALALITAGVAVLRCWHNINAWGLRLAACDHPVAPERGKDGHFDLAQGSTG
jgi:hypothetical protein